MKRLSIILLLLLFTCPSANAYYIDLTQADYVHYHGGWLYWIPPPAGGPDGCYWENFDGNTNGDDFTYFTVMPNEGESQNAMATISITRTVVDWLVLDYTNFTEPDMGLDKPYEGDNNSITTTLSIEVGTNGFATILPGDIYDLNNFFAYFNELPTPIDASIGATVRYEYYWGIDSEAELISVTPIPEPATAVLAAVGLYALFGHGRRRFSRNRKKQLC
jgi:hypothetical protein